MDLYLCQYARQHKCVTSENVKKVLETNLSQDLVMGLLEEKEEDVKGEEEEGTPGKFFPFCTCSMCAAFKIVLKP